MRNSPARAAIGLTSRLLHQLFLPTQNTRFLQQLLPQSAPRSPGLLQPELASKQAEAAMVA